MKVGILGGSFNPPHCGHIHISEIALKKMKLNFVWWIPTKYNTLKKKDSYEPYEKRLKLCRELTKNYPKIKVINFDEIYSERLVAELKAKYKNIKFFWITGADTINNLHLWEKFNKFISLIKLIIISREDFLLKMKKTRSWGFLKKKQPIIILSKKMNISSTKIRSELIDKI